jgi:TolB protein
MTSGRRRILLLSFAALAAAVAVALVAGRASGAAPGPWIVFSAQPKGAPGPAQLFRIHTGGAGIQQLTNGGRYSATEPSFSPDGKRIAFIRLGAGIYRMNADGSGQRRLTSGARDIYPVWSPDGKRIAFLRPYRAAWRVHTMPSAGGAVRRLPQGPPAGRPTWTKDGRSLLVPAAGDILRIDARTGAVKTYYGLTLDIQTTQHATVSPDGRTVAYVGPRLSTGAPDCGEGRCPQFALYLARVPAPHRPRKLLNDTGPAGWSPDGKTLVFVSHGVLSLRPAAGGTRRSIPTTPHVANGDSPPAWQPR